MAHSRMDLHRELLAIMQNQNVYYQPPANVVLKYPAIVYNRLPSDTVHADDARYLRFPKYKVLLITKTVDDSLAVELIDHFRYSSEDSPYISDNLYHYPITIYY